MRSPLDITQYSREHMIEQIMVIIGQSLPNPPLYREQLRQMTDERLAEEYGKIMDFSTE